MGGIGSANAVEEVYSRYHHEQQEFDINKIDACLNNVSAAASQKKDVLDKLVNTNKKLIAQLQTLTNKHNQLSGDEKGSSNDGTSTLKGKNLKFV